MAVPISKSRSDIVELSSRDSEEEVNDPSFPRFYQRSRQRNNVVSIPGDVIQDFLKDAADKVEYPPFPEEEKLGYYSMYFLGIGFVIGSGIYIKPSSILENVGTQGMALVFWLGGGLISLCGLLIYAELSIAYPFNAGDVIYSYELFPYPRLLAVTVVSLLYVLCGSLAGNAVASAKLLLQVFEPEDLEPDFRLQKLIALLILSGVCLAHACTRRMGLWIAAFLAACKIVLLVIVIGIGFLAGVGAIKGRKGDPHPPSASNLSRAFKSKHDGPPNILNYSSATLGVLWAYEGWVNSTWVRAEIRSPPRKPHRVFKVSAFTSLVTIMALYVLANVSYMTVLSPEELIEDNGQIVIAKFFIKLFGDSFRLRQAIKCMISIFIIGNLMSWIYSVARVKQEIAKMRLLPFSKFWAKQTHSAVPVGALALHWISDALAIVVTPEKGHDAAYSLITDRFVYSRSYIVIVMCLGIFSLAFNKRFRDWRPGCARREIVLAIAGIVIPLNVLIIVLTWLPPKTQGEISSYLTPGLATGFILFGVLYWAVYAKILPLFGYHVDSQPDLLIDGSRIVCYTRYTTGFAKRLEIWWERKRAETLKFLQRRRDNDDD